jgi:hypothetical protein
MKSFNTGTNIKVVLAGKEEVELYYLDMIIDILL